MARKRGWVVIGTADDGVREIGDGLGNLAKDRRAGAAVKGGVEIYQGEIESAKALGYDASLESQLSPEVDATVGQLEVAF
jgi:hypothetical protein